MQSFKQGSHCDNDNSNHFKIASSRLKKRCLFLLILGLMVMIIFNMALILWIISVMDFSTTSMGSLRFVPGGLQLIGNTLMLGSLTASSIKAKHGRPLILESFHNFTIHTRDKHGMISDRFFLGQGRLECSTSAFVVSDTSGIPIFSASPREVFIRTESLRVHGEGGTTVQGSVQTPLVRSESGNALRLESSTRGIKIISPKGIHVESKAADIKTESLNDITIKSLAGKIKLDSSNVLMPNLKIALPVQSHINNENSNSKKYNTIYQLCSCANGKLYLAQSHGLCITDISQDICR
ncbi:gamma-sarcoglycan-like [Ctenocephalides felis]|uniref:gamma-sarcoglycan-like n=1 Tax=Ctenocephalides felis TaxID=7515 RepID=UPI000E6E4786|nr:gamma-sarcoglycan-like [Ctenocephalides felis]